MDNTRLNLLSDCIISAAIEVHRILGPGLLEHTYLHALYTELRLRGLKVVKEFPIPCVYKGETLDCAFRADIIVEDAIIVELKATEEEHPVHFKQLYTYLRITDKRLGLLINFNKPLLVDGLHRIVNNF